MIITTVITIVYWGYIGIMEKKMETTMKFKCSVLSWAWKPRGAGLEVQGLAFMMCLLRSQVHATQQTYWTQTRSVLQAGNT